jgi:hypothetical protein
MRPPSRAKLAAAAAAAALALCALLAASACGPIRSTAGLADAERALRDAAAAGAEQRAPYPYALARELVGKAREEQFESEYSRSFALAKEAKAMAEEALRAASGGAAVPAAAAAPAPQPAAEPAPDSAPAPPAAPEPTPGSEPAPGSEPTPVPEPAP